MKVLSIREPFASLIRNGVKKIETRSFKTKYRGEIYIHASKTVSKLDAKLDDFHKLIVDLETNPGYILCKAKLVDCVYMSDEFIDSIKKNNYTEFLCGRYTEGRYAWILDEVEIIEPKFAKGQLGIWNYKE